MWGGRPRIQSSITHHVCVFRLQSGSEGDPDERTAIRWNLARAPFDVSGDLPASIIANNSPFLAFTSPQNNFLPQGRDVQTYNISGQRQLAEGPPHGLFRIPVAVSTVKSYGYAGIVPTYTIGYSPTNPYGYGVGDIPGASATDINTANSVLASVAGIISTATQSYNITSQNSGFVPGAALVQNLRLNNHAAYFPTPGSSTSG